MPIFANEMRRGWKSLIWWFLGLVAVCLVYLPFFKSMGDSQGLKAMLDSLPGGLVKGMGLDMMFTGSGYVQSYILELTGAVIVIVAGITWGASAVGGDEESGMLELTLAHGISRTAVYSERALAILVRFLILGAGLWAVLMAVSGPFSLKLDAGYTAAGVVSFTLLGLAISFIALAVGAATGRKSLAVASGAGVAVVSYMLNAVGRQADDSWKWLCDISPFGWAFARNPIVDGWDWRGIGLLVALVAIAFLVGLVLFNRRDVQGS